MAGQDLPDWELEVSIKAGQITATIVGPVTVDGTVNVANAVTVASITNPVTVGSISNTVNVSAVSAIKVENTTGGTIVVGGTITLTGTNKVKITGAVSVNILTGTVDATVLNSSLTVTGGPITVDNVVSTVLQVGDDMVSLYTAQGATIAATKTIAVTRHGYVFNSIVVIIGTTGTATPYCAAVVAARNTYSATIPIKTAQLQFVGVFGPLRHQPTVPHKVYMAIIPVANLAGTSTGLTVIIYSSGAQSASVGIWGLTGTPGAVSVRSDGRAYPVGAFQASVVESASGTYTVVAAPPSPLRILLYECKIRGVTTANAAISSTGFADLASIDKPVYSAAATIHDGGLLLGVNKAVALKLTVAHAVRATVTYDLVV